MFKESLGGRRVRFTEANEVDRRVERVGGELRISGQLIQPAAVRSLSIVVESDHVAIGWADRSDALQGRINAGVIVVITEVPQLPFKISDIPEWGVIEQLSTYCSGQSVRYVGVPAII